MRFVVPATGKNSKSPVTFAVCKMTLQMPGRAQPYLTIKTAGTAATSEL